MKWVCFVGILVTFALSALSQQTGSPAFLLKSLPDEGLLLNQNWTFYPDDDKRYALEAVEEKGMPVNPALLLDRLPQVKKAGFGWFRLKLRVDSALRNKTIGVMLSLFGAAEIYFNGKQVYRFGQVSADYQTERTQAIYARAISLQLSDHEEQILAVRFSHHPRNLSVKTGVIPFCLRLTLYPLNKAIDRYAIMVKQVYRFVGISLVIELASALITLFFFFSFPSRKEYLFFGLYFALNFLAIQTQTLLTGVSKANYISVNQLAAIQLAVYIFLIAGSLFHLNAMYALLHLKRTRFYHFLFWYGVLSMTAILFLPAWGSMLPAFFFPLACLELLPTYYRAARRQFKGGWILFSSILACFLILLFLVKANISMEMESISVLTAFVLLAPALGVMTFLAGDFARTSSALQARIVQVETLSEKSIAQEREKQELLAAQNEKLEKEVESRTAALRQSLADLKAAQAKLVQAEKMASLGELTAGIAHEIQNPLNFVNNFSETTEELLGEMQEALQLGNTTEAGALAEEMKQNLQKIGHHGRRADSIVKGMLQHSRKSNSQKLPTNINDLVDEYLRLSYHGFRAKDKLFHAKILTRFDKRIGEIEVQAQDIGRVLLNLFNNAFYAVNEKKKEAGEEYKPWVQVMTRLDDNKVKIRVKDNGIGIPAKAMVKIFQPFFTTKPAGAGTGLGLSICYDIVKMHGGELKAKSIEGEETEFTVVLNKEEKYDAGKRS